MKEITEAIRKAAQAKTLSPEETVLFLEKLRLPPKFDVRKIAESDGNKTGAEIPEKNEQDPQKK